MNLSAKGEHTDVPVILHGGPSHGKLAMMPAHANALVIHDAKDIEPGSYAVLQVYMLTSDREEGRRVAICVSGMGRSLR